MLHGRNSVFVDQKPSILRRNNFYVILSLIRFYVEGCTGMNCPRCKGEDAVKNGKARGNQRYKCKACGFQFTRLTTRGRPPWQRALAVFLYCRGVSISTVARMFSVSPSTIFKWIRKFGSERTPLPESTADGAVLLDENEIAQYLEKQSGSSESGKIFVVIPEDVLSENVIVGIKRD